MTKIVMVRDLIMNLLDRFDLDDEIRVEVGGQTYRVHQLFCVSTEFGADAQATVIQADG